MIWTFLCLSFDLRLLINHLVSSTVRPSLVVLVVTVTVLIAFHGIANYYICRFKLLCHKQIRWYPKDMCHVAKLIYNFLYAIFYEFTISS